jgi:DNA-binding MarR family transcriptional regulator
MPAPERPSVPPRTAFLLAQVGAAAADRFGERVAEAGLTPREAGAIRVLGRDPGIGQRELADRLGTVPARLVALLDELETRGLVRRERSATDRRNNTLWLTAEGERVLGELRGIAQAHQREILGPLDDEERQALAAILLKLSAASGVPADAHPGYRR